MVGGSWVVLFGSSKSAVGHGSARVKFVWREASSLEIKIYCVYKYEILLFKDSYLIYFILHIVTSNELF